MNEEKESSIKSGKEILDAFFKNISSIDGVDIIIANALSELYINGKLTHTNAINKICQIREENDN
jgi:hypothetical protein